jgi:capsular exopolysaccharide synthesis family protein
MVSCPTHLGGKPAEPELQRETERSEPMDDLSLRDYLAVLRQRRRIVILSVVVAVGVALAVSLLQTPRYRARAELLLGRTANEDILADELNQVGISPNAERELNNEIRLIESGAIRDAADERYDGPLAVRDVTASAAESETNDVINLDLESADPAEAADLVNLYADVYIAERRQRSIDEMLSAGDVIQTRLDEVREQIAEVSRPLDEIDAQVAAAEPGSPEREELEEQRQTVLRQVLPQLAPLTSRESSFRGQLQQLEVSADLTGSGGVEVLNAAEEPSNPVSPNILRNVIVAGLLGLLGGITLAFIADRLDDSIRSKDTVERLTDLPTLGLIPAGLDGEKTNDVVGLDDPTSAAAEAYRLLRTSVRFLGLDSPARTILITSPAPSEGKTVTAANLAIALAQGGEQVLLVGADFRRARVHELFAAPVSPGVTSVLLGEISPESTVYDVEEQRGLHLMPSGPVPPHPAELLESQRARDLFAELAETYDRVVVDSPPVLPVTDAQVLSRIADAVLLVVTYGQTSKRGLARAIELLGQVDAPVIGTVLNHVPASEGYGGQTYRYDTYRKRRERARGTATEARHAAGQLTSGNGARETGALETTVNVADPDAPKPGR